MENKKILIVGGVAGGATAAARLRRIDEEAEIILIEKGPYISFANCGLPYHISGVISDRESLLVQTVEGFRARFNVDVRVESEATYIDREKKELVIKNLKTGEEYRESYNYLILSPGAAPIKPNLKGINVGLHYPKTFNKLINKLRDNKLVRFHAEDIYQEQLTKEYPDVRFKFWKRNDCEMSNEDIRILEY